MSRARLADFFDGIVSFQVGEAGALVGENFFGEVYDVVALIAVGGKLGVLAQGLQIAGVDGSVEEVHLGAGVVNVVFAGDLVAGGLEDGGEDAAKDGAAGVADVDGAGGVDADEFDHDLAGVGGLECAEVVAGVRISATCRWSHSVRRPKLRKPGGATQICWTKSSVGIRLARVSAI